MISVFIRNSSSFNRQNISKSSYLKYFLHNLVYVPDLHAVLGDHGLVCGKQHAQTRGGYVIQPGKVQRQFGRAVKAFLQFLLQFRRCGRVQPALQGNGQFGSLLGLDDLHGLVLLHIVLNPF